MENQKIKKVQTETMYEVEFNNKFYTIFIFKHYHFNFYKLYLVLQDLCL